MNDNNGQLSDSELADILSKFGTKKEGKSVDTKYQYPYVELEYVMDNPNEYIIPQCLPACRALWNRNIETFMVSNNDDSDLYVLMQNLSDENKTLMDRLSQADKRFFFDEYRGTYGIGVRGNDDKAMHELAALVDALQIQDTLRFQTTEQFLESYKLTGGKVEIDEYGHIVRLPNPELKNATLQEALEKTGKSGLYVAGEGRIYESAIYLEWHNRYQRALQEQLREKISPLGSNRDNVNPDASHLRDTYLQAEREYIAQLLQHEGMRQLVEEINQMPSETLFAAAQKLVDDVEMGLIPEEQMERTEQQLTIMLTAIKDKVLLKELVKTPDTPSRSR